MDKLIPCSEILGQNVVHNKIRKCSDVLNDTTLERSSGMIKFDNWLDFLDVDIREIKHIKSSLSDNNDTYCVTEYNKEYIEQTFLNFIFFITRDDFYHKYNKIYKNRKMHFKMYFDYLQDKVGIYKPHFKEKLKNIIEVYHIYAFAKYNSLNFYNNYNSLNWIDVSDIKDMSYLFSDTYSIDYKIDKWDVSNVRDMRGIFYNSYANTDVSMWKLHPLVKVNGDEFLLSRILPGNQFKIPEKSYSTRFCLYYLGIAKNFIVKHLKEFFNYD